LPGAAQAALRRHADQHRLDATVKTQVHVDYLDYHGCSLASPRAFN